MKFRSCLTIAGIDNFGFSGIYNDLKTFRSLNCYGVAVITSIASQTNQNVKSIFPIPKKILEDQIHTILENFTIDATKIGMVYSKTAIEIIQRHRKDLGWIVLDPVLKSSSGKDLIQKNAITALYELLTRVNLITPNLPEILFLLNEKQTKQKYDLNELKEKSILFYEKFKTPVLLKGGHNLFENQVFDIFFDGKNIQIFKKPVLTKKNIRGTGCTLSSSIACYLAKKHSLPKAIQQSQKYLLKQIRKSEDFFNVKILLH